MCPAVSRRDILLEPLVFRRRGFDGLHEFEVKIGKVCVERVDRLSVRVAGRLIRDDSLGDFCTNPSAIYKNSMSSLNVLMSPSASTNSSSCEDRISGWKFRAT
jgi:hypothetical protein